MSRNKMKDTKKVDCSYEGCHQKDPIKKRLCYYYNGKYYCNKNCVRKEKIDAKSDEK